MATDGDWWSFGLPRLPCSFGISIAGMVWVIVRKKKLGKIHRYERVWSLLQCVLCIYA